MSQILGIKFSDHGPVCYFASGLHVLRTGQSVLVETDQGLALGRVATVAVPGQETQDSALAEPAGEPAAEPLKPEPAQPESVQPEPESPAASENVPAPFEATFEFSAWETQSPEQGEAADQAAAAGEDGSAGGEVLENTAGHVALFATDQAAAQPVPHSLAGLQPIHRVATEADLEAHAENRRLARRAFTFCRGCISSQNLDMKLVDVEVLHDRSKLIFFFTAPNRIDFRELIKSLVREFHTRIELRQIGVRHETQMIGAIGNCGQVCCCRRFLRKFAPVTIKMAKEQNLFLNPAKISGICGRLLCCLSYEQKGYEEFHKQCPKIGKRVQTPLGSVKVLRANFFKKSISVWVEDEGEREFTLEEWKEMLNRQPGDAGAAPAAQTPAPAAGGAPSRQGRSRPSTGRPSRPDRPGKPERGDRPEKSSDRPEKSDRPDKPERQERSERQDRPERPPRPERAQNAGEPRPERAEGPAEGARTDAPRAEGAEGEGGERRRPRRRRRRSKGPKPE